MQCILHTPTAIDMYCKRSKLLKKQGNLALAAGSCDFSVSLSTIPTYHPHALIMIIYSDHGRLSAAGFAGSLSE